MFHPDRTMPLGLDAFPTPLIFSKIQCSKIEGVGDSYTSMPAQKEPVEVKVIGLSELPSAITEPSEIIVLVSLKRRVVPGEMSDASDIVSLADAVGGTKAIKSSRQRAVTKCLLRMVKIKKQIILEHVGRMGWNIKKSVPKRMIIHKPKR